MRTILRGSGGRSRCQMGWCVRYNAIGEMQSSWHHGWCSRSTSRTCLQGANMLTGAFRSKPGGDSHADCCTGMTALGRSQHCQAQHPVDVRCMTLHRLTQYQHTLAGLVASPVLDAVLLAPAHHRHHVVNMGGLLALHVDTACRGTCQWPSASLKAASTGGTSEAQTRIPAKATSPVMRYHGMARWAVPG